MIECQKSGLTALKPKFVTGFDIKNMQAVDIVMCWARSCRPKKETEIDEYFFTCQTCKKNKLDTALVHRSKECAPESPGIPHVADEIRFARDASLPEMSVYAMSKNYNLVDYILCDECFKVYYDILVDEKDPKPSEYYTTCFGIICGVKPKRGSNTKSARGPPVFLGSFFKTPTRSY